MPRLTVRYDLYATHAHACIDRWARLHRKHLTAAQRHTLATMLTGCLRAAARHAQRRPTQPREEV